MNRNPCLLIIKFSNIFSVILSSSLKNLIFLKFKEATPKFFTVIRLKGTNNPKYSKSFFIHFQVSLCLAFKTSFLVTVKKTF